MRCFGLTVLGAIVCLAFGGVCCAGEAGSSGGAEVESPPVQAVGEIPPRPELQVLSGVQGWRVNGEEIRVADVRDRAALYHGPYILQDMVSELLLRQEARRRNIGLSEEELQTKLKALREQLGLRSDAALEYYLRGNRVTREWLQDKARYYALMEKVLSDQVYVSDREIERFYELRRDSYRQQEMVGFRMMSFATEEAAKEALAELRKGKGFQEVAREVARSSAARAVAGELQYYERGQQALPQDFEAALFSAPLNQVVGPVQVLNTYHLLRVEKKIDPHQFTLDEAREVIREQLKRQKLEQVVWPNWIRMQLANAEIAVIEARSPDLGREDSGTAVHQPGISE